jgi:hypothetical protein
MIQPKLTLFAAEAAAAGSAMLASLPVDKDSVMELAKWPATALLGGVACFCVWMLYKQGRDHALQIERLHKDAMQSQSDATKAINELIHELRNRPCLHRRHDP